MSIVTMYKTCVHCGRRYTYNPSTGRLGLVCPHCGRAQMSVIPRIPAPPGHPQHRKPKPWEPW